MSDLYLPLSYGAGVPGADTKTYLLFDTTGSWIEQQPSKNPLLDYRRYVLSLGNSSGGQLLASASKDKGKTWKAFYALTLAAATATANNEISIPVTPHADFKVEWINGGSAQATWYLAQGLDNGQALFRPTYFDAAYDVDPGDSQAVTVQQLPSSLGPKPSSNSLSVVQATDTYGQKAAAASQPVVIASDYLSPQAPASLGQKPSAGSASVVQASDSTPARVASLRAPLKGEVLPINVTTASKTYAVPAAWVGKHVRFQADSLVLYVQVSSDLTASADKTATCSESGTPLVLGASPTGACFKIPLDQFLDIPFPATAQSFAVQASAAGIIRTHLSET